MRPLINTQGQSSTTPTWTPLGPTAVQTANFGLITGRITSVAFDPSDPTGNHVYVGTTGGGVWAASNAAVSTPSLISFTPLTDSLPAFGGAADASISIGAVTVQPGGTGVILAGTGDPNDVLDSYYGAGILRSTDGGTTWNLIFQTDDLSTGLSTQNFSFLGEGFAGFAWSTVNPQLVVAAVSQAYEGTLVDATVSSDSMEGLYYSTDSGATWHLACITDGAVCSPGSGTDVQGPLDAFAQPDGNAATAVVWNPVRKVFIAAVRYHGYYQSVDGITWTRLSAQPGAGLTASMCPTNPSSTGSIACPIFRGALAVNPETGDTFAWSVDLNNQDQGIWQDECSEAGGACANSSISFSQQWTTAALESNTSQGSATIADGRYNLALAAVPVPEEPNETMVLAGANDLWQATCPASDGPPCGWRDTTNSTTCMSAQVGEFQHVAAWPEQAWLYADATAQAALDEEILIGNDSGLWRSMDAIGETGSQCNPSDASHFQNLNGALGSLAEAESISPVIASPYEMMAGLGVNGAAGVNGTGPTADWPQILGGYGGPVAANSSDWYVNDSAGVAIYQCAQAGNCTPSDFGTAAVTDADVDGDGDVMPVPADFLIDPIDDSQLLVATCRVWRGEASGGGWTASNAISPILASPSASGPCSGQDLIRAMAAAAVGSNEVIYVGMYGSADGGALLPGHVLSATFNPSSGSMPAWQDLTFDPVSNDSHALNALGFDISSIAIDPHDPTGNTVYVTVAGISETGEAAQTIYRSTNGGATWNSIMSNLPNAPVNAVAIDPESANTVYVATDAGVYYTTEVSNCALVLANCWSAFGSGLPEAPVVALSAAPAGVTPAVLVAGTYGRGLWQTNLWSAGQSLSAASASPSSLDFAGQPLGTTSGGESVTVTNTGSVALLPQSVVFTANSSGTYDFVSGPLSDCVNQSIPAGGTCTLQVLFSPTATGPRTAQMIVYANVYGGQLTVDLNGLGQPAGTLTPSPASVAFAQVVAVGSTSSSLAVTLTNSGSAVVSISGITASGPFDISSNACGATLAPNSACVVNVEFAPTVPGSAGGLLTFADQAGTQSVALSGTGAAPPTDTLSPASLAFGAIAKGQASAAQTVIITNSGDLPLRITSIAASPNFQESSGCQSGVAAHSNCTVSVWFAPAQEGSLAGTLTVVDQLGTETAALTGTGLQPAVFAVSPPSATFPKQQPGVSSAPLTLTITNSGGTALAGVGFAISGPGAADYSWSASTCGAQLASGAQCTVQVTFTPGATGSIAAALVVSSSTPGVTAASVPLNGAGQIATGLETSPAQLPFSGVIPVGQASTAQSVIVTNSSHYSVSSVAVAASGPFSLAQNTCTGTLSAGSSCTTGVVFSPNSSGSAAGTLTVSSTDVAAPASVALSGTGFDFSVQLSGPGSQTVTNGQQADYKLLIVPNGASGNFSFQCGTLPANAICIFNPASETLGSGIQGNAIVEIYTGSAGLSARAEPHSASRAWPLALAFVLLPFALRRRRGLFLVALLAVIFTAGLSSCTSAVGGVGGGGGGGGSGGSGGQGGSGATPAGTYSVPINVTASGLTQTVTVTLVVD